MRVSASRFAAALAARCGQAVPPPVRVLARAGGDVVVEADGREVAGSGMAGVVDDDDGSTWDERLTRAACAILGTVQDGVCEALTEPWPVDEDREMAMPSARIIDGRLEPGFGADPGPAVLALRPIPLDEIAAD